jgi:hypothetical protein
MQEGYLAAFLFHKFPKDLCRRINCRLRAGGFLHEKVPLACSQIDFRLLSGDLSCPWLEFFLLQLNLIVENLRFIL